MARTRFAAVLGQVVKRRREAYPMSQEALAEAADIHRTHVGFVERGERGVTVDVALQLAAALRVPLAELIAEAEAEYRSRSTRPGKPCRGG